MFQLALPAHGTGILDITAIETMNLRNGVIASAMKPNSELAH